MKRPHEERDAEVSEAVRCRNAGCDRLAKENKYDADSRAQFDEASHTYRILCDDVWVTVKRSTTALVHDLFSPFDAMKTIEAGFHKWESNPNSTYYEFIHQQKEEGLTTSEIKTAIADKWEHDGKEASTLGTALHAYAEQKLNGVQMEVPTEIAVEAAQFDAFYSDHLGEDGLQLQGYRTEFTTWYETVHPVSKSPLIVSAGQIDALLVDANQNFYIFDWKRVKPNHSLTSTARSFRNGVGLGAQLKDIKHNHYSLQTSIYALMLKSSHNIDINADNLYLVRMHANLDRYEMIRCTPMFDLARKVLEAEATRLVELES